VIEDADVAEGTFAVVVSGSSAARPARGPRGRWEERQGPRCFSTPPRKGSVISELERVEEWNFTSSAGRKIVGRIHYPPDFGREKLWPCIVYYYGGTSPVDRSFGGRYPKSLWAAHGYVVYVLQPSGRRGLVRSSPRLTSTIGVVWVR